MKRAAKRKQPDKKVYACTHCNSPEGKTCEWVPKLHAFVCWDCGRVNMEQTQKHSDNLRLTSCSNT